MKSRPPDSRRRPRLVLGAAVLFALAVGAGSSQAGAGEPSLGPPVSGIQDALETGVGALGEAALGEAVGDADAGEHCPRALRELGACKPHEHDPQGDFEAHPGGVGAGDEAGHDHDHGHSHPGVDGRHSHAGARPNASRAARRGSATGATRGETTLEQTIQGTGDPDQGFQSLRLGPGEPRIVREDLAQAKPGRADRRISLLYVGQTTDWQLADEESPARVEFFDITANPPLPSAFNAAWRPQEALGAFAVEYSIRQLNEFADASPVRARGGKRAAMDMALMTGDQADNQHLNETEWVLRLLEGGPIDPNSGTDPSACPPGLRPSGQTADPSLYAGVQDYDDYVEGQQFYDPDQPAGPKYADWPAYPGLMDRAQVPFTATGLDVPTYVVFGNHDGLAQGNQKSLGAFEQVGVGCVKPLVPASDATEIADVLDPEHLAGLAESDPSQVMLVPPDPRRRYVDKRQYKQVFLDGEQSDGYGFGLVDEAELQASNGTAAYYSWRPEPGLRMIGLDTLCEGGVTGPSSNGNVDDPQFRWLESELERASQRDELIIVFGHHPIRSLNCSIPDETPPDCTVADAHGHDVNPGCDADPRSSEPLHDGEDLTALFHRFPHVITYVAGHTHENAIGEFDREAGGPGDFWGIETASLVDWPPQNRLVELMDNCDGTLSIFGTTIDSVAPATAPPAGSAAGSMDGSDLGSISRTIAFNDPQAGAGTGEGEPTDRNVELLLNDPRRDPPPCEAKEPAPDEDRGGPAAGPDGDDDAATGTTSPAALPFTGLVVGGLAAAAVALLLLGSMLRRVSRARARAGGNG